MNNSLLNNLAKNIKAWGRELGFIHVGITDIDVKSAAEKLNQWLQYEYHGEMDYLRKYKEQRAHSKLLVPEVKTIISCALNYFNISSVQKGYVANYALGRDYHKIMRERLNKLAKKIHAEFGIFNYRCFVDSAPVFEKPLAVKAGIGWQGKNSLIINRHYGSWLVLGEIFTDLKLPIDKPHDNHCGNNCSACINACPTKAIIAPYIINANHCIAYLTIEHQGSIPLELRPLIGNKIYGCDVCQLSCPMNKYAQQTKEKDFFPRHNLDSAELLELFNWSEEEFLAKTEGSAIRRIGYERWLRNIAVALGNEPFSLKILEALRTRQNHSSSLVCEHIEWAFKAHHLKSLLYLKICSRIS